MTARRVLARAAVLIGGVAALAERLELTHAELAACLTGAAPVPDALFLRAIDIVLEELPAPGRAPGVPAAARSLQKI